MSIHDRFIAALAVLLLGLPVQYVQDPFVDGPFCYQVVDRDRLRLPLSV